MKCQRCDNEATVHEVKIKGGVPVETHLCEQCAKGAGLPAGVPSPVAQVIQQIISLHPAMKAGDAAAGSAGASLPPCPSCGLTFAEFRQKGQLGCPACYESFEKLLIPLLSRAHERAAGHVGKRPRAGRGPAMSSAGSAPASAEPSAAGRIIELRAQLATLQKSLEDAVSHEQYERAASVRDQIRDLQTRLGVIQTRPGDGGSAGAGGGGAEVGA